METISKTLKFAPFTAVRLAILILAVVLAGCSDLFLPTVATPLPAEYLPTAAALTLAARGVGLASPTSPAAFAPSDTAQITQAPTEPAVTATTAPSHTPPAAPTDTSTSQVIQTLAATASATFPPEPSSPAAGDLASPSAEPAASTDMPSATPTRQPSPGVTPGSEATNPTPAPPIPEARIQIYRLGELSKIISPLEVSSRLTCGEGKVVRVELYGEDGRLLARDVRTFTRIPWKNARVGVNMDFEINSAAELARLVISAEDSFGRLIEVNSVNLILLSLGMTELNPASALGQRIIIQEPMEKAIIQGGRLIVSGRAKPETNQPLRVMLVGEDGRILGQRLAAVSISIPGDYGTFVAEVPYSIQEAAPALLVVFEEGRPISEITFLTSQEVLLAP